MNRDYEQTEFSKSLMAGVFAGIAATVTCLIFNFSFRDSTGFGLSQIINVSSIIFVVILFLTIAGTCFYLFHHYLKQGTLLYILFSVAGTLLSILLAVNVHRSPDPAVSFQFKELLIGIIIITGIFGAFILPYLYNSKRI